MPARSRCFRCALLSLLLAACGGSALGPAGPALDRVAPLGALPDNNPGRIELRRLDDRPRLTLVSRDGDPSPAVAAVFATDAGPALTTALAGVVEGRLRAAGFDPDMRVDRDAFRARFLLPDPARAAALFAALASAAGRPVTAGSPEVALAGQRLASLKRNPLDAAELAPIAACTGALGVAPGDPVPDLAAEPGVRELEAARRAALHVGRISVGAVGPAAFGPAVAEALGRTGGWPPPGAPAEPPPPGADVVGVYTAPSLDRHAARVTLAARIGDPALAALVAERLGAADAPLADRLRLLPEPWHLAQIVGVARASGGCVSVVLETAQHPPAEPIEVTAAIAAAVARREIAAELGVGRAPSVAARQILTAPDPRDAASRAAWWALATPFPAPPAPPRWATALGVPAPHDALPATGAGGRFSAELDRALGASSGAERRLAVERGQGELWLLLASPCGVAEENASDAGFGALAVLADVEARRRPGDVTLEPWVTPDGMGVIAHAGLRDERETGAELARRVADAAARALTATVPPPEALAAARAAVLDYLQRTAGRQSAALEVLAPALSPEHPSWVEPFGLWDRVAGAPAEGVALRGKALGAGPLRLAIVANADAAQAATAADAVDRWLSPAAGPRLCHGGAASSPHAGRVEARLPSDAPLAQGLVGAPLPLPATPGGGPYAYRDLADLTAAALDGPGGLLAGALAGAAAVASARVMGGARAPALVIDVRAPEPSLASALGEVKALLVRLPTTATEADLGRAAAQVERREQDARADPRRRLTDLWAGRAAAAPPRPSLTGWRAFLGAALREAALTVVEARAPER